ncbi:imelysin family protein [Tenacibaculum maritimum]|nr:imelysin family protein [Tenacibaculum maritimum]CAA0178095.1 Iron regulated protein; Imelysin family lipoprotein precursor [Tenacibaculum maritimum]CAA0223934.1 Iron regulated protein; Imelysin family lipoprotein precursor [Tenacibaculum maritimum]
MFKKVSLLSIISIIILYACSSSSDNSLEVGDGFERKEMLTHWANNLIVPGYTDFAEKTENLKDAANNFAVTPNQANLLTLRTSWKTAYMVWQKVSIFQIGKAETLNMVSNMNTFPTNIEDLTLNITSGNYDLTSQNEYDEQGFPALDYMINGVASDDASIIAFYTGVDAAKYKKYLNDLVIRIDLLAKEVLADWNGEFKNLFIENDGSSITSSVDKLVNFYVVSFFEREVREKKISFPSGVRTGTPIPRNAEAYYKKDISKVLLEAAFDATEDFFNGKTYDGNTTGKSLKAYLQFLKREDLIAAINTKITDVRSAIDVLDANFVRQINTDNTKMTLAFDKLQLLVKDLKVDMASAMSIKITIEDNDGD